MFSYFFVLGVELLFVLKLGLFDKLIFGSDFFWVCIDEIMLGSGLVKMFNVYYDDWLDVLVVNIEGGQGVLLMKLCGIFEFGIKDYDDVVMKILFDIV